MTAGTLLISLPTIFGLVFAGVLGRGPTNLLSLLLPFFIAFFPWVGFTTWRTYQARILMREGYRLPDLQYALQVHAARRAEELSFQYGKGPTRLGKVLRKIAYGGMFLCIALAIAYGLSGSVDVYDYPILARIFQIAAWASAGSAVLGLAIPGRDLSRDRLLESRQRFWQGRWGRLMLKAAGIFQKAPAAPERALNRPTELALGHAADALFALPPRRHSPAPSTTTHARSRMRTDVAGTSGPEWIRSRP